MAIVAEPMRREILRLVWDRECSVGELVEAFDVTQPAISFHLRVLREEGLVRVRSEGRRRYYRAHREALGDLAGVLESFWTDRLNRLSDAVEQRARQKRPGRTLRRAT